ncbi:MAG: hypothetical protein ACOYYS_09855, partial [Chloroflexota bacterium]
CRGNILDFKPTLAIFFASRTILTQKRAPTGAFQLSTMDYGCTKKRMKRRNLETSLCSRFLCP